MLSLDFADTAIIEIIATARIMAAIVPNSGTTKVPIISISSVPAGNAIVSVLSVEDFVSSKSASSASINTKKSSSPPSGNVASNTDLGNCKCQLNHHLLNQLKLSDEFALTSGNILPSNLPPSDLVSYQIRSSLVLKRLYL